MNDGAIKIDQVEYKLSEISEKARAILDSIQFTENELLRLKNLVSVLETAKMAYQMDLRRELPADHPTKSAN